MSLDSSAACRRESLDPVSASVIFELVISPVTPLSRAARVALTALCCGLIIVACFSGPFATVVVVLAVGTTVLVGIIQLIGLIRFPIQLIATVARVAILLCWCALIFVALVGLFAFNYCEANCPSTMNPPTAGIVAAVMALNAGVLWLGFRAIPRWVRRGEGRDS